MKNLLFYWAPAIAYMAGVLALSLASGVETPETLEIDKVLHFGAYGVMAALWMRAIDASRVGARASLLIGVSIVVLFGALVELAQGRVPEREASLMDALANAGGALTGALLYRLITHGKESLDACP